MIHGFLTLTSEVADMSDIQDAVTTGLTSIKGDLMDMLAAVLPIALAVVGAGIAITFGIRYFKKIKG